MPGLPGARLPSEEPIDPSEPICDPHHHIMDRDGIRYSAADLTADLAAGHNVVSTVYVECGTAYRPDGPDHLRPVGEVEFVVSQQVRAGVMAGIVAHANLGLGAAVAEVLDAHLAIAGGRLRGIRFMSAWDPALDNHGRTPGMLADPHVREGIATVGRYGLCLECWMYGHQLGDLADLAWDQPEQVFVLDHLGTPLLGGVGASRRPAILAEWRQGMRKVAACPNVMLKIGGLAMHLQGAPWSRQAPPSSEEMAAFWAPEVDWCLKTFGVGRCMFESNFPIDRLLVDYVTVWNTFKRLVAACSANERRALLHDNAVRTYRLAPVAQD